jgi:hypothetical protein
MIVLEAVVAGCVTVDTMGTEAFTAMIPELMQLSCTTRNTHRMLRLISLSYQLIDPRHQATVRKNIPGSLVAQGPEKFLQKKCLAHSTNQSDGMHRSGHLGGIARILDMATTLA